MKNKLFYILTNKLHKMKFYVYLNHLKNTIFKQTWFKKACKEKKIKIIYLSKDIFFDNKDNVSMKILHNKLYFHKLYAIKFIYKELDNNNHVKLLNINIKNEVVFRVASSLVKLQKIFIETKYYQDAVITERKNFIKNYIETYNSYLDTAILSKILNHTEYIYDGNKFKLSSLLCNKIYIYSLYIKEILYKSISTISDKAISRIMCDKYKIHISRRKVCYIRNKYFIRKNDSKEKFNFYTLKEKLFSTTKRLDKQNIKNIKNNTKGIYELLTNIEEKYPYVKNNTVYIGSSNNLKKRLSSYTIKNAHSKTIKDYIEKNNIYFRIIKTFYYKKYEMLFINAFINMSGNLPKLNKQHVLNQV